MPLSWNEIHARTSRFAASWKDAHYEKGETQSFYNELFEAFGRRRRDVAIYEQKVKKLDNKHGFIDLFWPGQFLVEQKSAGRSLDDARAQAIDYLLAVKESERPRYLLLSDFQNFEMVDLETRKEDKFTLAELPDRIKLFGFVAGYQQQEYKDQDPVNIDAANLMRNLHEKLKDSGYTGAHLERLLVRIMFCLFAEDTGIFQPDSFLRFVEDKTREDGSDLGPHLIHLFQILDSDKSKRSTALDESLADFPYVNGALFADRIDLPSFDPTMREALLKCCYFNWSKVSPALFGSLFQTVMQPEAQRKGGAHYTSEKNILKTIHPLFLNDLQDEFKRLKESRSTHRRANLERFHNKLGLLKFFDPACGCGNFLILAYRELRLLEVEVLEALNPMGNRVLDVSALSKVDVDQFYGIEIEEFAARIAEAAMWLVDHQMNMRLSDAFGQAFVRLPLQKSAHIVFGNALEVPWESVCDPKEMSYILGNPPFIGARKKTKTQSAEMARVFAGTKGAGDLDYVAAWYMLASRYIQNTKIKVAFVSTNSIAQGEQVGILWKPLLTRYDIHIHFGHRTFKWTIDEKKGKNMKIANVFCVIVGFAAYDTSAKALFEYETVKSDPLRVVAKNINPYLVDAVDLVVTKRRKALGNAPPIAFGNMPNDGGHFLMTTAEKDAFLKQEPGAKTLIRPILGSTEFINGKSRWCLWLKDADPTKLRKLPQVMAQVAKVKKTRLASKRPATKKLAATPTLFGEIRQPTSNYLAIPEVSSQTRFYLPMDFLAPNVIASNKLYMVPNAGVYHFGVLSSLMHMAWMRHVGGRLKADYQYSSGLPYNNFPWPTSPSAAQIKAIEGAAHAVLDVRKTFPGSTLAHLYGPLTIPPALLKAHQALDRAVDRAYRRAPFGTELDRMEYLFVEYQRLTAPLIATPKKGARTSTA